MVSMASYERVPHSTPLLVRSNTLELWMAFLAKHTAISTVDLPTPKALARSLSNLHVSALARNVLASVATPPTCPTIAGTCLYPAIADLCPTIPAVNPA